MSRQVSLLMIDPRPHMVSSMLVNVFSINILAYDDHKSTRPIFPWFDLQFILKCAMARIPNHPYLMTLYSNFIVEVRKDGSAARTQLQLAAKAGPNLLDRYFIYHQSRGRQEHKEWQWVNHPWRNCMEGLLVAGQTGQSHAHTKSGQKQITSASVISFIKTVLRHTVTSKTEQIDASLGLIHKVLQLPQHRHHIHACLQVGFQAAELFLDHHSVHVWCLAGAATFMWQYKFSIAVCATTMTNCRHRMLAMVYASAAAADGMDLIGWRGVPKGMRVGWCSTHSWITLCL